MISTVICIIFLGFYVSYNTSKKVIIYPNLGIEKLIQKHSKFMKLFGLFLLLLGLLLMILILGIGAGTLTFFIVLMTVGSLIILINPLKHITYKNLVFFFVLSTCIEFLLF